mgnify:CR=1 FL=1
MKKLPKITALILTLSLACGCSEVFPNSNASGKDTSAYTLPSDPVSSEAPSDTESEETEQPDTSAPETLPPDTSAEETSAPETDGTSAEESSAPATSGSGCYDRLF